MTVNIDRTTAAMLAAEQAHLARVHDDAIWARKGFLGRLRRGERPTDGWRRLAARRSVSYEGDGEGTSSRVGESIGAGS